MIKNGRSDPLPPNRVVVLGARGFVGGDLVDHLSGRGVDVLAVSSSQVDLTREESIRQVGGLLRPDDALVVISAITPDKGKDVRTLMANLAMGEHVAAVIESRPCAHVVYVSSDAVYDDATHPVRESSPAGPTTFHGLMHLVRERMLHAACVKARTPLAILRPSLLYGAADTHNGYGPNRFLRTAWKESAIALFGEGEEKRDHVHIRDLSRLIGSCLELRAGGTLNVATGVSTSFHEVARLVSQLAGKAVEIRCSQRQSPITHRHFDTAESLRAFPCFRYTAFGEGLAMTWRGLMEGRHGRG